MSKPADNQNSRMYDMRSPFELKTTADGLRAGQVQIRKEFADSAMIRILTLTVDGQRQTRGAAYYDIPLNKYLKKAPGKVRPWRRASIEIQKLNERRTFYPPHVAALSGQHDSRAHSPPDRPSKSFLADPCPGSVSVFHSTPGPARAGLRCRRPRAPAPTGPGRPNLRKSISMFPCSRLGMSCLAVSRRVRRASHCTAAAALSDRFDAPTPSRSRGLRKPIRNSGRWDRWPSEVPRSNRS